MDKLIDGFDVRRCRREDYKEFLDVLNEAFGHSAESCWFQQNIDNCTPYPEAASDELIARHVVAADRPGGAIMGGVGVYPFELVVAEDAPDGMRFSLPAVGVGQVSCAVEYRNRGVMSKTLKTALDDAVRDGAVVGFLGGDRYRYGRFGFDYGGAALTLDFSRGRLKTAAEAADLRARRADAGDIAELDRMYATMPSYIKRSRDYWKMQLGRACFTWLLGELDGGTAYIAHGENKAKITEIRGDPKTALAMILWHMETNALDRVSVSMPFSPGRGEPIYAYLRAASSHTRVLPCGMNLFSIFSADKIYKIIEPAIRRAGVALENDGDITAVIKYMLGAPDHPIPHGGSFSARRLTLWISDADNV